MPLFSVHSNRSAGERDYEVQGLVWAASAKLAAITFFRDWMDLGWRPGVVVVTDIEPEQGQLPRVFEVVDNLMTET